MMKEMGYMSQERGHDILDLWLAEEFQHTFRSSLQMD